VLRHRVYKRCLGNERAAVWRHRGCSQETYSNAVAWRHRGFAEKTPPPLTAAQRARRLAEGYLAALCCATPAAQPNSWLTCHNIFYRKLKRITLIPICVSELHLMSLKNIICCSKIRWFPELNSKIAILCMKRVKILLSQRAFDLHPPPLDHYTSHSLITHVF
jgi:hypothetical protein